jgi:hypothetical protein
LNISKIFHIFAVYKNIIMNVSELKQPYRRMAEYLAEKSTKECYYDKKVLDVAFDWYQTDVKFWSDIDDKDYPPITEEIKKHFPNDFDFSGEEKCTYPFEEEDMIETSNGVNFHKDLILAAKISKDLHDILTLKEENMSLFDKENQRKIEDENLQKRIYTQLAKEGKFDNLPDTCEFSELVELEVGDDNLSRDFRKITGKYKGNYMDIHCVGWKNAQLPTQKIDFSQFTTDDVVEVETKHYGLFYGVFCLNEVDFIRITFGDKSDLTKQIYKDEIKSITKIK